MTAPQKIPMLPAAEHLRPVADDWSWQLRAACREADPDLFFHPDQERGRARSRRERLAKQICQDCPVLKQCRRFSLEAREPYGVWGGVGEVERFTALDAANLRPAGMRIRGR